MPPRAVSGLSIFRMDYFTVMICVPKLNSISLPVDINPVFLNSGIFIWWPQNLKLNVSSYTIQFWHNNTSNPTIFSDQVIGTTVPLDEYQANDDIEEQFEKIAATTNIYSMTNQETLLGTQNKYKISSKPAPNGDKIVSQDALNETVTEVRVSGNVTGILIPNTKRIVARVLIPIMYKDKEFHQDLTYVQWKAVSCYFLFF